MSIKPKVLIVSGYHPDETLAAQVGETVLRRPPGPHIKVVRYTGKADKDGSTRNLRRFIENFDPELSIVLHSDDNLETNALIFYQLRPEETAKMVRKLLLRFVLRYAENPMVFFGFITRANAKRTLIDLELGSQMELEKAVHLTACLANYFVANN